MYLIYTSDYLWYDFSFWSDLDKNNPVQNVFNLFIIKERFSDLLHCWKIERFLILKLWCKTIWIGLFLSNFQRTMKLKLTKLSMTLSKKASFEMLSRIDTQHNYTLLLCWMSSFIYGYAECHCAEYHIAVRSVISYTARIY